MQVLFPVSVNAALTSNANSNNKFEILLISLIRGKITSFVHEANIFEIIKCH